MLFRWSRFADRLCFVMWRPSFQMAILVLAAACELSRLRTQRQPSSGCIIMKQFKLSGSTLQMGIALSDRHVPQGSRDQEECQTLALLIGHPTF
jgi:hypothetical protein